MYFADTICSGWSSWRGIVNILVMAKFMNFDADFWYETLHESRSAVKHLIHPSVPLAYPFEWMNVIRRRPVWYFSRTHTVIVRGGLFKYHWKMQADCGNHIFRLTVSSHLFILHRVAALESACNSRTPDWRPLTRSQSAISSSRMQQQQHAAHAAVPLTITKLTKKLRDREDEIFQLWHVVSAVSDH